MARSVLTGRVGDARWIVSLGRAGDRSGRLRVRGELDPRDKPEDDTERVGRLRCVGGATASASMVSRRLAEMDGPGFSQRRIAA